MKLRVKKIVSNPCASMIQDEEGGKSSVTKDRDKEKVIESENIKVIIMINRWI